MRKLNQLSAILFLLFWSISINAQLNENNTPYLVVLSLDGFRWDYTDGIDTPNFDLMAKKGVKAESIQPSFPSKTFPNHYTLATGLYPGNHGLVNNSFYDAQLGTYKISNREAVENPNFYGGEPIWNTAEKQGVKSACFYWVGSEAPIQNMRPSIWKKYNHTFPWEERADSVISWLSLPEQERPHLIMWYLPEPDETGHHYGPNSKQTAKLIKKLDAYLGDFLEKLATLPNADQINFIVTTDHGMGETHSKRYIDLSKYISQSDCNYILPGNPVVLVQPKHDKLNKLENKLKEVENLEVYRKGEFPDDLHYNNNTRISDLVVVADSAWSIGWGANNQIGNGGAHGYNPSNKDMHGIFYAIGPAFKTNFTNTSFQNVDLYSLMAEILNLTPAETDGTLENVKGMLK